MTDVALLAGRGNQYGAFYATGSRPPVRVNLAPAGHSAGAVLVAKKCPSGIVLAFSDALSYELETPIGHHGTAMLIGYARTSTTDQRAGLEAQERDLRA